MDAHTHNPEVQLAYGVPAGGLSPVASTRVKALAERVIEGAPALTFGEMRELAEAILEHNMLSDAET